MKFLIISLSLLFFSCTSSKDAQNLKDSSTNIIVEKEVLQLENSKTNSNVKISINTREPYCGGAYPREEQLNNHSVSIASYLLINLAKNDTFMVETDSLGFLYLNLKNGKYEIRELYKNMSFAQFQDENKPKVNQALLGIDQDCYKKWWAENLLKFEIVESNTLNKYKATIAKRCRTGRNPCLMFTGRLPN